MDKVHAISPPADSRLAPLFADADLVDAYAVSLPAHASRDVVELARAVVSKPPAVVEPLMRVRNAVMSRFGVKTSGEIGEASRRSAKGAIGAFAIKETSAAEVVMGEDDRHLDFHTSIMIRQVGDGRELVWITAVHCNDALGRLYLTAVGPFHRRLVPAFLAGAARRGWPTDGAPAGAPEASRPA